MVLHSIKTIYYFIRNNGDPRTENMPLVKEPIYIFALVIAYLVIVIKGPKWMAHRDGFELRKPLVAYNFFLVALSAWMMYEFFVTTIINESVNFLCHPLNPQDRSASQMRQLNVLWVYFFSKVIEFMDTFFFILRKRNRQLTFLHVYHHASIFILEWLSIKYAPGPQCQYSFVLIGKQNWTYYLALCFKLIPCILILSL